MNDAIESAAKAATFSVTAVTELGCLLRPYIRNADLAKYCGARKEWAEYASSETAGGNDPTSALNQHKNRFRITHIRPPDVKDETKAGPDIGRFQKRD